MTFSLGSDQPSIRRCCEAVGKYALYENEWIQLMVTVDERETIRAFELKLFRGDETLCVMDTTVNGCNRTGENAALTVQVDNAESITRLVYPQASLQVMILRRASTGAASQQTFSYDISIHQQDFNRGRPSSGLCMPTSVNSKRENPKLDAHHQQNSPNHEEPMANEQATEFCTDYARQLAEYVSLSPITPLMNGTALTSCISALASTADRQVSRCTHI